MFILCLVLKIVKRIIAGNRFFHIFHISIFDIQAVPCVTASCLGRNVMMTKGYQKLKADEEKEKKEEDFVHPKQNASCLSLLFFSWFNGLMKTGNERPLEQEDLLPLLPEDESQGLAVLLEENWNKELKTARSEEDKQPQLWKALYHLSPWYHYVAILLLTSLRLFCNLLQPVLLSFMLAALIEMTNEGKLMAYAYGLGICLSSLVLVFAQVHMELQASMVGMRIRTALVGLIYKRVLHLSLRTLHISGSGNLMNLVTNDVERFRLALTHLPTILLAPLESIIAMGLLCWFTGWPSASGIIVVVAFITLQLTLAGVAARIRGQAASFTDKRVTLTRQMISGIRTVKMYTWEEPYKEFVLNFRRMERKFLRKINLVSAMFQTLYAGFGRMTLSFVVLLALLLSGHVLTPVNVFLALVTANAIKPGAFLYLGVNLKGLAECRTSLERLKTFLVRYTEHENEVSLKRQEQHLFLIKENTFPKESESTDNLLQPIFIEMNNACCSYDEKTFVLSGISFRASDKELVVISGPVGSGKSSLLDAIIGELPVLSGTINRKGTVGYVTQIPWVFSGTLRDNIVFYLPFNYERYQAVIKDCELESDLAAFPNGDLTIVGERGVILSGGQRSRINLARAVYSDSDIYLLDDPLSAVDAKVGRCIFQNAICGLLRNRLRILVTHHEQYEKYGDHVITLADGQVVNKETHSGVEQDDIIPESDIGESYDQDAREFRSLVISEEDRIFGHVTWKTYVRYMRAALPLPWCALLLIFVVVAFVSTVLPDWWISRWTDVSWARSRDRSEVFAYIFMVGGSTILLFVVTFLVLQTAVTSSTNIHNRMLDTVIRAPVLFFDTNPTGRILNRFTKDIGIMDELLPSNVQICMAATFSIAVGFVLPSLANYWVAVFALPLVVACIYYGRYFIRVSRETTRLQAISYSPVLSHFSDTLDGLAIIRTYHKQKEFMDTLYRCQDNLSRAWFANLTISRWLAVRTNVLCFMLLTSLVICSLLTSTTPGLIGLSVMYAAQMLDSMDFVARMLADVENDMTSVERTLAYTEINSEPGYRNNTEPQKEWPQDGSLNFEGVSEVYYDGGPLVLKDITFKIENKEKIGIVGRTGAGKSSLVAALMRMPEPQGKIFIDGVDIKCLNLYASRRVVSVIPQNPVLFSGKLRSNIDPFGVASDADIFGVLQDVHLKEAIERLEGHLDYQLMEGGSNFSVGERQLICLARALLQGNKIIVMDEATANVDYKTDQLIQETIREKFKECTVLTIAHRVNTIMDCDRVFVLHQGQVVEFGKPSELLKAPDSVFAKLWKHAQTKA